MDYSATGLAGLPSTTPSSLLDSLKDSLASRLDFSTFFSQHTRLLQIDTALPSAALIVEKMQGREAVNEPFRFEVDCLSTSAHLELKTLLGEQVTLRLLKADGSWRAWHGYVVQAAQLGSDGGAARYRLSLASWLHFLQLRQDSFIFQDQTALQVVEAVFADHPYRSFANWRIDVSPDTAAALRMREICTQYSESDFDFITRLLAEEGLSYHFEHEEPGAAQATSSDPTDLHARHCLVITDTLSARPQLGALRLGRPGVRGIDGLPQDTLTQWRATRRVRPTRVTLAQWRPTELVSATGEAQARTAETLPPLEVYAARSHAHPSLSNDHTSAHAQARLDALRLSAATFEGTGAARLLAAGCQFSVAPGNVLDGLSGGDLIGAGSALGFATLTPTYTALVVEHHAANNLGSQAARLLSHADVESGTYQQRFEAVAADTPIVPPFINTRHARPTARNAQVAEVVGLQGETVSTDRDLRVKVQFPWQRGVKPLAGGLTDTGSMTGSDDEGNATGDERSGFWLRVAQPSAGANWGSAFVPRIGAEVLVDFVDGDIDQPLIVGQLPTPSEPLPWAAGAHTSANHPGTISGLRSQGLDQQGGNEWLHDDAPGQLRMRLRSWGGGQSAHGELSLGHIVQQADCARRGPLLGQGFYAASEGWTIVRAGKGLLLTTAPRSQRGASVESTQMDAAEALSALQRARQIGQALSDSATQQGAQALSSHASGQAIEGIADSIDPQRKGQHASQMNGQDARKARNGSRDLHEPVEAFAEPHIVLDAAASLAWATSGPAVAWSGQHTSLTSGADTHTAAAHTVSSVSGRTTSLYTHAGGAQVVAANGPLSLRAHTGAQDLLAEQGITITSSADEIHIQASDSIVLTAGQSQVELKGGDITFTCPGAFTVKAASHDWEGPGGEAAVLPLMPTQRVNANPAQTPHDQFFVLRWANSGRPMAYQNFRIRRADGTVQAGTTDANGRSPLIDTASQAEQLSIEVLRSEIKS